MVNIIYFLRPLNKYHFLVLLFLRRIFFLIFVNSNLYYRTDVLENKTYDFTSSKEAWKRCEKFSVSKDGKLLLTTIS